MTDTTFVDQQTIIPAAWCNDINDHVYNDTPISPSTTVHDSSKISNSIRRVANVAAIRSITPVTTYDVETQGYYSAGDGGHGTYYGVTGASAGTYVDNGVTIIVPTGGNGSGAWLLKHSGQINVKQAGAKGDGTTDDTTPIKNAVSSLPSTGGDIIFPNGDYRFNLDVSGNTKPMQWIADGSVTFRPYLASPTAPAIIYANNSSGLGTGASVNIIFRNINFTGRFLGDADPLYGRVDSCVRLLSSWAKFYDCAFTYGTVAGFYSKYGQYNEFYSCSFGACINSATTAGCMLDSNTVAEAANENIFIRCKFNTNKNGLVIKGGSSNRIIGCQFQSTVAGGSGALVLMADATGYGTDTNWISGNYFEGNSLDVYIGVAPRQTFEGNIFLPGTITTTTCYDLRFFGNTSYGGSPVTSFNHPALNTDAASLTWIGNGFDPTVSGLPHAGPTRLHIDNASTRNKRNDNMLFTTGQSGPTGAVLVAGPQYGFKTGIARTVSTPIFRIDQETFGTPANRHSAFEVVVNAVNDEASSTQYGYCSRIEKFHVFITNNTTGAPQVYINTLAGGVDTGISPAYAAIGALTLSASVSTDAITFSISYSGAGSNPTALTRITAAYEIRYTGANQVMFTRQ